MADPAQGEAFDLAVVGAGPGGAAAALAAAGLGLRVALFDPRLHPDRRAGVKPCGEGLMPAGVDALRRLGLAPDALGRPFPGVRYVAAGAAPLDVDFGTPGVAIHRGVLQRELDARIDAAPGITVRAEVARARPREGGGFTVEGAGGAVRASALVVADGGHGRAADWLGRGSDGAGRTRRGRTGLRVHCEPRAPLDRVEVHFGGASEVYLTPLPATDEHPRGLVNVVLLFDELPEGVRGGAALLHHALARHPRAAASVGAPVGPVEARALGFARPRAVARDGAFLVGDASGGVDPVLGCGTTVALRTGVAAALAASALREGASPRAVARDFGRVHARETRGRRRVAGGLILASKRARTARAAVALARALPAPTRLLVRFAERVEPLTRGTGLPDPTLTWAT